MNIEKYGVIFSLLLMLTIPISVSAQVPKSYPDIFDQLQLRNWSGSNVKIQNDACDFQNSDLRSGKPLKDFILKSKISMDPDARLVFSYSTSYNDEYEFTITPTAATLMNYIRFGNASNTVRDKLLAKAPLQVGTGQWVGMEFGMQAHRQWLTVDGKPVIDRKTARFPTVGIRDCKGVYFADIQLVQTDLSVKGEQLSSYPPRLVETWIAFENDKHELALVHPDGTGMQVLVAPSAESYSLRAVFSPNGKTLLIAQSDNNQTLLSFYSLETLQFTGVEITLPRSPIYDWMPDGQHLILRRDENAQDVTLEKINIQTGRITTTFAVPVVIDEQVIHISSATKLDCSPTDEIVSFEVHADAAGENVQRAILFDLTSQQAHFLPGSQMSLWSPDGDILFSRAGGLIDSQSLVFTELPSELVKQITYYRDYAWSPNGQFIHIGTKNAGNEEYAVDVADLETQKVITLPLIDFGSFAPDSLHFVFGDAGRVIVRTLFDDTELQIAEGTDPIWQPAPGMYPVEPIRPVQTASTPPQSFTSVPTTESTHVPLGGQNSDSSLTGRSQSETEQKSTRPAWPFLLFALSLLGLASSSVFAYLRYLRRCRSCKRSNPGSDPFCMYCGARLAAPARIMSVMMILAMLAGSGCLAVGGVAGLLIRPKQNTVVPVLSTASPELTRLDTPQTKPTENYSPSSADFPCGTLDLARADLLSVLQMSETSQTALGQSFGQMNVTPAADMTAEAFQVETLIAGYEEALGNYCPVSFLSISPDKKYVLISGNSAAVDGGDGFWAALYNRQNYKPIWVQSTKIETPAFDEFVWNSSGDRFAVSSKNLGDEEAITVYETNTGLVISKILASTREGAFCSLMDRDEGQVRWLPDGKRLIRKIDNAVQVLDATTSNILNEVVFDDSAMGSPYSLDDNRCLFVMAWASDGSRFATLGASIEPSDFPSHNGLKIWDAATAQLIAEKKPGMPYPSRLSFSPDGTKILVTGYSPMIIDAQTAQTLLELNGCPVCQGPSRIIWTPDSQRLLLYEDKNIGIFDLTTQSWKTMSLSTYRGNPQEWLDDDHVLMTENGIPTIVDVTNDEEMSLLEYFRSSP